MAECDDAPGAAAEAWRAFAVSRSFLALGLAMWRGGKQAVASATLAPCELQLFIYGQIENAQLL